MEQAQDTEVSKYDPIGRILKELVVGRYRLRHDGFQRSERQDTESGLAPEQPTFQFEKLQ